MERLGRTKETRTKWLKVSQEKGQNEKELTKRMYGLKATVRSDPGSWRLRFGIPPWFLHAQNVKKLLSRGAPQRGRESRPDRKDVESPTGVEGKPVLLQTREAKAQGACL